jgi:arylsulfatase A-like enzyme
VGIAVAVAGLVAWQAAVGNAPPILPFRAQACALPHEWLTRIQHGYFEPRSGQINLLPQTPAYFSTGPGGWSHSGPWNYLQRIPIVFYAPGLIPDKGTIARPVSIADIAPTVARLLGMSIPSDGKPLAEVRINGSSLPRLILTVVWDGGGWNALDQWPHAWPNLARIMQAGITYTGATDGSSPSVTPAIHATIGTGMWPEHHGITDIPVRDESGTVVDAYLDGESSRFLRVPTLAERWDERNGNKPLVGMVGYEPWHLGMIGQGAERPGGDKDDAAWLDRETNDWITNPDHYRLPPALPATKGLQTDLRRTDAADGRLDGAWRDNKILADRDRWEETPGFIDYHTRGLENMIRSEGYGRDTTTDLLFTNYKQIDRNGHYYNMDSPEVRDSIVASDRSLGRLVQFLNRQVGASRWALVFTADHGQQPDQGAIDGYGINPKEVTADINAHFGDVAKTTWPTQVFLLPDAMKKLGVTVDEVARFLDDYRLRDNVKNPTQLLSGAGRFDPSDRLFEMAIPSHLLPHLACGSSGHSASPP